MEIWACLDFVCDVFKSDKGWNVCLSNKEEYCMSAGYFHVYFTLYLLHLRNAELYVSGCVFNNMSHDWQIKSGLSFVCHGRTWVCILIDVWKLVQLNVIKKSCVIHSAVRSVVCFCLYFSVNELLLLTEDCRYLVLLAKVQSKVNKNDEALLSLQRVSWVSFSQKQCYC